MILSVANINPKFAGTYKNKRIEARKSGSQTRFYEVDTETGKEVCLTRETIKWMIDKQRILWGNNKEFIKIFKHKS